MKSLKIITIIFYILISSPAWSQDQLDFEISVAGFSIGEMTALKSEKGDETFYDINSKVSFWFFGKVNLDYSINSKFKGRQLVKAKAETRSNKGEFASDIVWKDDKYIVEATSYQYEKDTVIHHPLYFSSAKLYFEEPVNYKQFMAENYGLPSKIIKQKDYYEVIVNGNRNKFYYENGKFQKAVMQSPIKNYIIKRKSP